MKKILFVFNPNSGKARIKYALLDIIQEFTGAGYEVTVYPTRAPRDGYNYIVKRGADFDIVACSGGDGTLNEAVDAVLAIPAPKRPPIGYIPSGSTNDFASTLGISKDMSIAAKNITSGIAYACDVGNFNGRSFTYVAAFGAFTDVPYSTPQEIKNILGHQAYMIEAAKRIIDIKAVHMKLTIDGTAAEGDFIFGMVSNSRSVGGMKTLIGQEVGLNDGRFELTFVRKPTNPIEMQKLINAFITQAFQECSQIISCKCEEVLIQSDEAVDWVLDGEYGGKPDQLRVTVRKSAVRIFAPQKIQ